jgi:acetylornithine deacetylase
LFPLQLLDQIDSRSSLELLSKMIRIESYSESEGERQLASFVAEQMRELGLDVELQEFEGRRMNAIGRWRGSGGGKSLLFNGHLDTNPVGDGWTVDPWGGRIDDRFVYGIGASNMKAGNAAYLSAVKTLIDHGLTLRGDVILSYVVGELQHGVGTLAAIERGLSADYFICCEPTDLAALTMHAAAFTFTVELHGMTRHLSKREEAVDAIEAACELIPLLNGVTMSAATPDHAAINRVHVGVARGGLGSDFQDARPALVADHVRLSGSARYAPGLTEALVLDEIGSRVAFVEDRYPGLKTVLTTEQMSGRPMMPPFDVAKDATIVQTLNRAFKQVRGQDQPTGAVLPAAFFGTDASHLAGRAGIEGVVCGPGGRYNTMPDERVDIPDYFDAIRIYMLAILDICEVVEH